MVMVRGRLLDWNIRRFTLLAVFIVGGRRVAFLLLQLLLAVLGGLSRCAVIDQDFPFADEGLGTLGELLVVGLLAQVVDGHSDPGFLKRIVGGWIRGEVYRQDVDGYWQLLKRFQ